MKHDDYSQYNPEVHKPFSPHLTVEQGEGTKGRPQKNTIVEMTAPPEFIKRFKPTKCGRKVDHVDGIEQDSASDFGDQYGEAYNGVERHIIAMAVGDDEELSDFIFDNIDNL